jgi:hypothetical protein
MVLHMIWFEVQKFCIEFHVVQVIPCCTVVSLEVRDPLLLCFWCSTLAQLRLVLGRPRLTGEKPTQSNATASRKVIALILRLLWGESMLSLNVAAMARAPWPRLPLVESSLRESLSLNVAFLNALEYRSP